MKVQPIGQPRQNQNKLKDKANAETTKTERTRNPVAVGADEFGPWVLLRSELGARVGSARAGA
jgi:hypothetical protein